MNRIRPIRFNKVNGIADLGKAGAGLLVKLDAEGPGRSWFALLPSGSHDPADMRAVDLKDAEPVCPDCPRCYGTAMSLPYDSVIRTCEGCDGSHLIYLDCVARREPSQRSASSPPISRLCRKTVSPPTLTPPGMTKWVSFI